MKPNLNTHKKRHGTFMYPGSTGFKFRSTFGVREAALVLPTAVIISVFMFMAIVGFSPLLAVIMAILSFVTMTTIVSTERIAGNLPTPEELEAKFKTQIDEKLKKFKEDDAEFKALTKMLEDVKTMQEQIGKLKPDDAEKAAEKVKEMQKNLDTLALQIKAFEEKAAGSKEFKKNSIAATLKANEGKIKEFLAKGKGASLSIEHKATETSTDIDGRENYFTWHQGGAVGQIPVRQPFMRELFTNVATITEYIKYIDQESVVRDAKNVALCGTTTSDTKLTWKTRDLKVEKIRDFVDICLDMMNDYSFVQGEIERLLNTSLQLKIDSDLLVGSGASPVLNSIDEIASTFNAAAVGADYSNSVTAPNLIDLISIAGAQIRAFGLQNAFRPNVVLLNPRDLQGMKYLKDDVNNYIKNNMLFSSLFTEAGGRYYIDGMLLIENSLVPENEFYIGDFTKGTIYTRPGVGIEFSYENASNFTTETVTVKLYERMNLLIRNVDINAFMHCDDIEAGLVAIEKV